jgi:tetratricopeptide (TPR) repeat protein
MNGAPVKDATIDIYRTDLPGNYTDVKSNKDGRFVHAGLPFSGMYIISISAPGASPQARGPMRITDTEYTFELTVGDGKRLTKDEAKQYAASGAPQTGSGQQKESEEQKKAREEYEKKLADNKKAGEANEIVRKSLDEGNAAYNAKNYDNAISAYSRGIEADPTHPGAPVLLTNKAVALKARGVDTYNSARGLEGDAKTAKLDSAKADLKAAAEASTKAVELLKAANTPTDPQEVQNQKTNMYNAYSTRADSLRLVSKIADSSQAETAFSAYQEYMGLEMDPTKKANAQLSAATVLLDAGIFQKALDEFKKVIEVDPNSYMAYRGLGIALFSLGYEKNDKNMLQEAANYLQLFVDKSPDTLTEKGEAKSILENLKNEEKIKAQKISTPSKSSTTKKKPN